MSATPETEAASVEPVASQVEATAQQAVPAPKRKKRLANDHIGQLQDHLEDEPLDLKAWIELIEKVEAKDKIEQVRGVYEDYLTRFPFRYSEWIKYINYELQRDNFEKVEEIFRRCLFNSNSMQLWKLYISYVFRKNNLITGGEDSRRNIFQAFDIAIDQVGFDPQGLEIWQDYLEFIDSWKPINNWDSQQKMDLKRKIYQKVVKIPIDGLEKLWNNYIEFENELNSTTARKFIGETSPGYMKARSFLKEILNLTKGIVRTEVEANDRVQLKKWLNWINWETENKLELNEAQSSHRIEYFFANALQVLSFNPELWFKFINFIIKTHGLNNEKIDQIIKMSLNVLPGSILINFKIVEIYELQNESKKIYELFNKLVAHYTKKFNTIESEIEELKTAEEEDDEKLVIDSKTQELQKLSKIVTLIYVEWFKSTRRLSGMKEARQIFALSRNNRKTLTHHIFHQAAIIESQATSIKTCIKVFELGLKPSYFNKDGEYIYKYLNFLIGINDDLNLRTVFETTITTKIDDIDSKWVKLIFKLFIKYELKFGKMNNVSKLQKKFFEKFPKSDEIEFFAALYHNNNEVDEDDDLIRLVDDLPYREDQTVVSRKRTIEDEEQDVKRQQLDSVDDVEEAESEAEDSKFVVKDEIYNLLRVLPNSGCLPGQVVDAGKLVVLLNKVSK